MSSSSGPVSGPPASPRRARPAGRGDFITIALSGDFGKPRPALIIQADQFEGTATVTVLLVSSTLVDAPLLRVTVHPSSANGLQKPSQVMVDKAMTLKREKVGRAIGHIDPEALLEIERRLAVFLGIAK
jgi:mRNA interferase MazF